MTSQRLELPAVFPARVDGQQSMVVVTESHIKWHPAPTEFSATRISGGSTGIAAVTTVKVHELGGNAVLQLTCGGRTVRIHAAAELIERVRQHVERARPEG